MKSFFQFVIAISSICTTLAAIPPPLVEIDEMYSKLLGLPINKDEATRDFSAGGTFVSEFDKNLKMDLDFVLFKQDIAKMLYYAEKSLASEEHKQLFDKKQKNFDEFFGAVQEHSLTGICEIWKFWRNLGDEFAKNGLMPIQAQIYVQSRQFIDAPRRINCAKIEQLFKEDRNVKKAAKEKKGWAQLFLDDLKFVHFNAIKYALIQKYDDSSQKWKFSKLFDAEMMSNETNFAFQLRLLHVEANADRIRHIKSVIKEHLIDEEMLLRLEMYAPAVFVPEIVDDQTLADKYIKVTTTEQKTSLLDVELSIRIYFGRIWQIFGVERFQYESDRQNTSAFNELVPKFPFLLQIFRNELTDKQIEEKQIENYINFLDSNKSKKVSKIARLIIDMLAYHQWFKTIGDGIRLDEDKQLITKYLEAIELWIETLEDSKRLSPFAEDVEYFNFLEQGKKSLEVYLQRDANANLSDKKSAKIPIGGTLKEMHGGTVGNILSLKSFRDKLKRIEINKKRMNELFDDVEPRGKAQKVEPTGKGQIATKSDEPPPPPPNIFADDSEIFVMAFLYQQILIGKESMASFSIKLFNTDAVYFLLNDLINDVMGAIRSLNTTKNAKLQRMVSQILKIAKSENFGEKSPTFVEKIKKSCYMQSFLEWVTNNGTMHSESAPWRKFVDEFGLSEIVKGKIGAPSEADFNWNRPNCEDEKEKADTFPTIQNLTTNFNTQNLYENIFRASSMETVRSIHTELSLRNAVSWLVSLTDEQRKSVEIVLIESLITLRIIDIFEDDKVSATVRMLCTTVAFINMTTNTEKLTKVIWKTPAHCFRDNVEADPTYFDQSAIVAHWHINFFREYLLKCSDNDLLVQSIRETMGSLYTLGMLVGSDAVFNLMSNEQIRPKIINQNQDYFDSNKYGQEEKVLKTLMDQWRLYLRFVYESISAEPDKASKYALLISNLMLEMDKFLITNKNNKKLTSNSKKLSNVWLPKEIAAVAETEFQWFEAKNEPAPTEMVQKMHFKQLKKLRFNRKSGKNLQKFLKI
uniref:Uncharacterized protein n=1 Tax=Globodera rostochiensis TaxID=31243 RepID=A0A914HYJ9_GLORO